MNNYGHYPRVARRQFSRAIWVASPYRYCVQPSYSCHCRRLNWFGVGNRRGYKTRWVEQRNRRARIIGWNEERYG